MRRISKRKWQSTCSIRIGLLKNMDADLAQHYVLALRFRILYKRVVLSINTYSVNKKNCWCKLRSDPDPFE
jgi:hypothetical protein